MGIFHTLIHEITNLPARRDYFIIKELNRMQLDRFSEGLVVGGKDVICDELSFNLKSLLQIK